MIIKEYRIPLPMTVEEYRIAQLYMIQKKSRNETYGEGSGVEILENRPYTDGPGGSGQYTHKVYHVGRHIPSWFRSILPKAALRVVEESWNAYPYTRTRFTCPFVEKFSIDIETFYKTDAGENPNVFSLSPVERSQLVIDFIDIVKDPVPPNEYRTEEDPKLFHSIKTQRGPLSDNWIQEYKQQVFPIMCAYKLCKVEFRYWGMQSKIERFIHDTGLRKGRGLKKQWSTSSKSSRSSKRGASPSRHSISEWRMQSIARDSDESSEDEFFDAHEDLSDSEETFPKDITKWNSNDLMDKIESPELEDTQDGLYRQTTPEFRVASSVEQLNTIETKHKTTLCSACLHFLKKKRWKGRKQKPSRQKVPLRPRLCSNRAPSPSLSPYSHDEGCLSSSQDHIPLAALPLLATSSPQYQEAVATVIQRANLAYGDFIKSQEGMTFNGQVCLIGDCVGGILAFDALCYSSQPVSESQSSSRRGSVASVQVPGIKAAGPCRHLSRSNIDIPRSNGTEDPKRQLPRKRSDSSTYELDTIQQHQAFLSRWAGLAGAGGQSRTTTASPMLDGTGALGRFDFEVADLFLFGCPLGLVLALRKTVIPSLDGESPAAGVCGGDYMIRAPLGDGCSTLLVETVQRNPELVLEGGPLTPLPGDGFLETSIPVPELTWQDGPRPSPGPGCAESEALQTHNALFQEHTAPSSPGAASGTRGFRRASEISIASQVSGMAESYTASSIAQIAAKWWGQKRIDYALYCPDALTAFPTVALPHLFHASYWESTDVVSFLLRQVMRHDSASILELDGKEVSVFTPSKPREKWQRKRTHVKLRNVTANHRINDAVANEDGPQVLTGRFMYGPLDMVTLTGEKVDVHIMTQPPSGEWLYLDTLVTNSSGRVSYTIPETHRLGVGVYPVKMVVRGDHTFADSYITVLPRGTEFVVFSIDGSFAASVSIMGSDPKVRAGAVDVVRHWQDLGYLIIYVTGRPDMQKQRVVAWLAQHNFPHGVVSFCDGLVHDPLRHKANFLKLLISELHLRAHAAYGSTKDVVVYSSISLSPMQIYIVGRPTKKLQQQCQFITDGYAAHLAQLKYNH
ncbi:PREDICTED: membrane-associated phosphatidylinositol transfer protein 2, partial [Myotis davidii]|uniref:membrane-associated phosphatidylinositol transfer protein 2 n=1 Tax=Myotis davidii TaxID=225400 RepID=UPI00076778FC